MDLMRFYSVKGNCSRTAIITVCALLWVKVAERMGEAKKEDDEKEKERESNHFWTKNFLSISSLKALTDYVYFASPEVINKSMAS